LTVIAYYSNVQMHEIISYLSTTANSLIAALSPKEAEVAGTPDSSTH
jgi:hypothetical protein